MRAHEFLTELFSPKGALPIEWESHMGAVYANAIDHNTGKKIEIHFWQLPEGAVEIDFMVDESYQLTNRGDQFIVFATVVNAIKEYDDRYAPKFLIFSAKEASRKSLYSQMVKRLAPTVGYTIGTINDLPQEVHDNISLSPSDFVLIHQSHLITEFSLPKNQWELVVSNSDKEELGTDLVSLVRQAYTNTPQGSFVNSIKDVIPSDWNVIDWDQDPDVDSCVFYRSARPNENWNGYKIQGIGHDGTRTSKDKAISKIRELLTEPGVWIESSDAMRHLLKKLNVQSVTDEQFLQQLFNDPELKMIGDDTYVRHLTGGSRVTETVFGNPKLK